MIIFFNVFYEHNNRLRRWKTQAPIAETITSILLKTILHVWSGPEMRM